MRHLHGAERAARSAGHRSLDPLTRVVRALLLDELARYRRRGVFPSNPGLAKTPIFVDARGTRCAMAHLLELGGERALVETIARDRNLAYVRELADEPRLLAWLRAAGLTLEEAAAIQPEYCAPYAYCICGGLFGYPLPADGVLDGTVLIRDAEGIATVRIAATYGDARGRGVGEEVRAHVDDTTPGTRVLVPVSAAFDAEPLVGVLLSHDGTYACRWQRGAAAPLAAEDFVAAVTSEDCAGTLVALDRSWARDSCHGPQRGCAIGGSEPSSLGILLAVVSVLAARARRARRARPTAPRAAE
jgi:hypothetical protein